MAAKKTAPKRDKDSIFRLRITLQDTDPLVWREVLVPGSFTLEALHSVFQLVMGWQMSHLYEFEIAGQRYTEPDDFEPLKVKPVTKRLAAALVDQKAFNYTYDFGDGWLHRVQVLEVRPREAEYIYPICVDGENACPPEDCGGVGGFADLKAKLVNKEDPDRQELLGWLGGFYNPRSFDPNRINRDLLWTIDWTRDPNDDGLFLPYTGL